jgi:hypothetical protein
MKTKLKLLFSAILFISYNAFSQPGTPTSQPGTTMEEYNYVTKGYQAQLEMGLDMKKGYELVEWKPGYNVPYGLMWETEEYGTVQRNITFHLLVKPGSETPVRAIMVKYNYLDYEESTDNYLCIPNCYAEQEIWDLFRADYSNYSTELWQVLTWALAKSKAFEVEYTK